jgi:hypothetical protein
MLKKHGKSNLETPEENVDLPVKPAGVLESMPRRRRRKKKRRQEGKKNKKIIKEK